MSQFNRRTFLRGAGGVALATPFLSSLTPKARAATDTGVKRLITFCSSQGSDNRQMFANTSGLTGNHLGEHVNAFSLNDISGPLSEYYDSRWDTYRDEMLFLRHLDPLTVQNHSHSFYLGGWNQREHYEHHRVREPHETIDRIIARHIYGDATPADPILNLGAGPTNAYGDASISFERHARGGEHPWNDHCGKAPVDADPRVLFDRIFRDVGQTEDVRRPANQREQLLVDSVLGDYRSVRGGRRISRVDRDRLDAHMEQISALETRLRSEDFGRVCAAPEAPEMFEQGARRNDPLILGALVDVSIAALRCDLSRVVNIYSRLEYMAALSEMTQNSHGAHHGAKHDPQTADERIALDDLGHHARLILDYVHRLTEGLANSVDENGESMLQSSIIYSTRELAHVGDHWMNSHPVLLIGGSNCLNTGQQISYATDQARPAEVDPYSQFVGRSYAGLLTTLMTAMGLQPEDWAEETDGRVGDYSFRAVGVDESDNILQGTAANAVLPHVLRG